MQAVLIPDIDELTIAFTRKSASRALRPDPSISVSQWAEKHRILPEVSREPGRYHNSRAPHMVEIMDSLSVNSECERVIFIKPTQISATTGGENWIGYVMDCAPGPILMVEPDLILAAKVSRQHIGPMLRDCKVLRGKFGESTGRRESDNTIMEKTFPGGFLAMAGANSAAGFRMQAIRYLFLDEVDEYDPDVEGQGDPVDLAIKRTDTFEGIRKIFITSTPTIKDYSRIEAEYELSDKRIREVPCPHCGTFQELAWDRICFGRLCNKPRNVDQTHYHCIECEKRIDEHHKDKMLNAGVWTPTAEPLIPGTRGYRLSALYSLFKSWRTCAEEFLKAKKKGRESIKVWTNTVLAETWEEDGDAVEPEDIQRRGEAYPEIKEAGQVIQLVPKPVLFLTAGVDTQDNRLEMEIVGWGMGEESWGRSYRVIHGDPTQDRLWDDFGEALSLTFPHEDGYPLPISAMCIDSGGHHTQRVYNFCQGREIFRHFAIKGSGQIGRPIIGAPSPKRTGRGERKVPLYIIGTDQARASVLGRIKLLKPGPGYCHFPIGQGYDPEYFRQLTAMKSRKKYVKGVPVRDWILQKGRRKEAFDCRMYALAAMYILNPAWEPLAENRAKQAAEIVARENQNVQPKKTPRLDTSKKQNRKRPIRRHSRWMSGR